MQLIAEVYDILHRGAGLPAARDRRRSSPSGTTASCKSYLIEITAQVFERDRRGDRAAAGRSDPGRGAAEGHRQVDEPERLRRRRADPDGQRRGRSAHALGAQDRARRREPRAARAVAGGPRRSRPPRSMPPARRSTPARSPRTRRAWRCCAWPRRSTATTSIRGEVAKIWRAGCIIRASLLGDIRDAFERDPGARQPAARRARSATRSASARTAGARRADGGRPRHSGAGDGRVARILRFVSERRGCRRTSPRRSATSSARTPTAASIATASFHTDWTGPASTGERNTDDQRSVADSADGALDFLSLGALIHRLDPGVDPVSQGARPARFTSAAASSTPPPTWPTASACAPASPPRWSTIRSAS